MGLYDIRSHWYVEGCIEDIVMTSPSQHEPSILFRVEVGSVNRILLVITS